MRMYGIFTSSGGRWWRTGAVLCGLVTGALFLILLWHVTYDVSQGIRADPVLSSCYLDPGGFTAFIVLSAAFFLGMAGAVVAAARPGLGAALLLPAGPAGVALGPYLARGSGYPITGYHVLGVGMLIAAALAYLASRSPSGGAGDAVQP